VTGVTARVPAKLNLQLAVGPPRADGYHDLVTVFHAVSLFDQVTVEPAKRDAVTVTGEGAGQVPGGQDNLALRAVTALRAAVRDRGTGTPGVQVTIAKKIPVGSDVAFALLGGTSVGRGRGEQLTPALVPATQYHWVLAFADGQLSTPEVYASLDRLRTARPADPGGTGGAAVPAAAGAAEPVLDAALMSALRAGDARRVGPRLSNDLQPAAVSLFPALRRTLKAGLELGALGALVAGSGPTCVFLAASAKRALDLAVAISGAGVCRSVARVTGPVPGAAVVSA